MRSFFNGGTIRNVEQSPPLFSFLNGEGNADSMVVNEQEEFIHIFFNFITDQDDIVIVD